LGSLVLPAFITGNINTNWQKLERVIKLAVRFLDNVIDVNKYSLKELDIKGHNSRRIGLGVMGLADYLLSKEIRYGSDDATLELERLFRFIRNTAYQASVELAVEKGAFPKFEPTAYGKASFIRKLPGSLRLDIKEMGIRNCTLLTVPPVGTTSLIPEVSSGVEPVMYKAFRRVDRVSERIYIHPRYKKLLSEGKPTPNWFVDSTDLTPKDHFETQATIQRYIDGSISKTLNFPAGTTPDDLSKYLLEYMRDLKGATIYIDGTKEGQVYNKLSREEVLEYIMKEGVSSNLTPDDVDCSTCKTDKDGIMVCEIGNKDKPL
jgi:ribonucleoside-diphosphate reductase alpha chain